jgi:hypothetical protein
MAMESAHALFLGWLWNPPTHYFLDGYGIRLRIIFRMAMESAHALVMKASKNPIFGFF